MVDEAMIGRMTPAEQMQAMELLWHALSRTPGTVESPRWHAIVMAKRLRKIESGEAEFLSIEQVKQRMIDRKR
jgi:hypothetical protein